MSVKNIFLIILTLVVAAAIIFFTIQENQKPKQKIDLFLRLQPGEHHELKLAHLQETIQTYKDKMFKLDTKVEALMGFDVVNVDADGAMNLNFYYKAIAVDANNGQQHIIYDSAKPPVDSNDEMLNAIAEVYSAVIGNKLSMKVSQMGESGEIKGFDEIRKKLEEKIRKDAAAEVNDPNLSEKDKEAIEVLRKMFMESATKQKMSFYNTILASIISDTKEIAYNIFTKYPDRPVSTGNSWYDKTVLNLNFEVDADVTYIFKRKENGVVYIDVISDVDMGKDFKIAEITSREKITKNISGVRSATNAVDEATGLLHKSEAIIKFKGTQHVETDKTVLPIRPNMDIPIRIEGSTIIELIK